MMNDFTTNLVIFYLIGIVVCLLVIIFKNKWLGRIALATGFITLLTYMVFLPSYTKSDAWLINGYSFSEYIITFSTFLYGFIVTRFLDGWAFYFAKRKELRVNITFVLWSFLIFGLLFDFWWGLWDRRISSSLSIGHFCFSLAIPLGFYLLSSVLFSGIFSKPFRAQLFITDNAFLFFGSLIFIFVADFAFAVIIHQRSFQDIQNLFLVLPIGLCTIALAKRSVLAHRLVLVLAWTFLIIHNFV